MSQVIMNLIQCGCIPTTKPIQRSGSEACKLWVYQQHLPIETCFGPGHVPAALMSPDFCLLKKVSLYSVSCFSVTLLCRPAQLSKIIFQGCLEEGHRRDWQRKNKNFFWTFFSNVFAFGTCIKSMFTDCDCLVDAVMSAAKWACLLAGILC